MSSPSSRAAEHTVYPTSLEVPVTEIGKHANASPMKYILLTGGTVSGLGKGTATASIGVVLKSHGLRVTAIKVDPHLNVDAGSVSPIVHGEVYVLSDGGQVDLDLGTYERFLDVTLTSGHNITSGKLFEKVIQRERTGQYLGESVKMVPHVTDAFNDWIVDVARTCVEATVSLRRFVLLSSVGPWGTLSAQYILRPCSSLPFEWVGKAFAPHTCAWCLSWGRF